MPDRDEFVKDLARHASRQRDLEASVFWASGGQWADAAGDPLDAEEIGYYAEGLLMEGFGVAWRLAERGGVIGPLQLYCWQGTRPALPELAPGASLLAAAEVQPE